MYLDNLIIYIEEFEGMSHEILRVLKSLRECLIRPYESFLLEISWNYCNRLPLVSRNTYLKDPSRINHGSIVFRR
jgi:hypothetical protein